jgi:hypothetical protein
MAATLSTNHGMNGAARTFPGRDSVSVTGPKKDMYSTTTITMASKALPNGTANPETTEVSSLPYQLWQFLCLNRRVDQGSCHHLRFILKIYGNLQDGLAECIANEDGERQIASAIAFHGEKKW